MARGTLGQQALQAPRNLLLNGTLARDPGAEGAVAAFVGRAAAAALAPAAAQQWLADVLAGAKVRRGGLCRFLVALLHDRRQ